jgi:hypothetical protein
MKLKQWLREQKQMTYAEYKALPECDRREIQLEHQKFCRYEQMHDRYNWRPMTEEELRELEIRLEKEKARYELNLKIGGIDERGNYTALHHRW